MDRRFALFAIKKKFDRRIRTPEGRSSARLEPDVRTRASYLVPVKLVTGRNIWYGKRIVVYHRATESRFAFDFARVTKLCWRCAERRSAPPGTGFFYELTSGCPVALNYRDFESVAKTKRKPSVRAIPCVVDF